VASLLEVGTGFHPELTGRENIYLNGAILGMSRREINRRFDEIVQFAEVERFLDTPVKKYSSGMHVRLAFAIAAHLDPDILVVDEVLAVGDFEFQKRCLGKLKSLSSRSERTVLFVSHDMAALEALCERGLLMSGGAVVSDGPMRDQLKRFRAQFASPEGRCDIELVPGLKLASLSASQRAIESGQPVTFAGAFESAKPMRFDELCLLVYSPLGARVFIVDAREELSRLKLGTFRRCEVSFHIDHLPLVEGEYSLGLWLRSGAYSTESLDVARFTVVSKTRESSIVPYAPNHRGVLELVSSVEVKAS
jgi:lipopolysaccharide transport system ATP-binding protein